MRPVYHFTAFLVLSVVAIGILRSGSLPDANLFFWILTGVQLMWGLLVFPIKSLRLGRIGAALAVLVAVQALQYAFNFHQWRPEAFSVLEICRYFIFVALVEEVWFRGVLQKIVAKIGLPGLAIASVLFGLYHIQSGWTVVLTTTAVGSVYVVARHLGAGILSLALAHGAMNWLNNTVYPPVGLRVDPSVFYVAFSTTCVIAALLALAVAGYRRRRGGG
ncbi:CPBP family intramembrane metalloprotease [Hwanghaeella grinnelliae]|uniref:CPBP family intramembrane metalloprotease n=1 Tax=Hwanghaeella grinnelliae TaxID=2500179 RepID=A0A437QHM9_9PROT|nr:CPBP family intramembrane glutamic endopeptidase [Hwanghaeella grinnelliae]RVU33966.1 CPBP family intramembrane metalloprotease [Hwanghaeella grinnelliae]